MKRSDANRLVALAKRCFASHGWALPPDPQWDICDFGLGDVWSKGLLLVNLADEPEYCEKLMYQRRGMVCLAHTHIKKKEDIICRWGRLQITVWNGRPREGDTRYAMRDGDRHNPDFQLSVNGRLRDVKNGEKLVLNAGERVTLTPGIFHSFEPLSEEVIIGEVSTANDDVNDNVFADEGIGRFPFIEEDEAPAVRLISD